MLRNRKIGVGCISVLALVGGVLLSGIAGSAAQAQMGELPPNPDPGKCYVKCITKDTFRTVEETVEVSPAYKVLKVIPATYKMVEERVLITELGKLGLAHVPGRARCAPPDPLLQQGDFFLLQPVFRRHGRVLVLVTNGRDEQRILEISRHDRLPGVAALQPTHLAIEQQTALLGIFGLGMALITVRHEDRPDLFLEKDRAFTAGLGLPGNRDRPGRRYQKSHEERPEKIPQRRVHPDEDYETE